MGRATSTAYGTWQIAIACPFTNSHQIRLNSGTRNFIPDSLVHTTNYDATDLPQMVASLLGTIEIKYKSIQCKIKS